jgi:acetyl/propionyl-CoA carboxylase alpha subunit
MIAKLVVWGEDRKAALRTLDTSLNQFNVRKIVFFQTKRARAPFSRKLGWKRKKWIKIKSTTTTDSDQFCNPPPYFP